MSSITSEILENKQNSFYLKHLNKLRWVSLSIVFVMLILLPFISVYQNYVAAHGYDLLTQDEKYLYGTSLKRNSEKVLVKYNLFQDEN